MLLYAGWALINKLYYCIWVSSSFMFRCVQRWFVEELERPSHKSSRCQMTMFVRSDLKHCGDLKVEGVPCVTENSGPLSCLIHLTMPYRRTSDTFHSGATPCEHVPSACGAANLELSACTASQTVETTPQCHGRHVQGDWTSLDSKNQPWGEGSQYIVINRTFSREFPSKCRQKRTIWTG